MILTIALRAQKSYLKHLIIYIQKNNSHDTENTLNILFTDINHPDVKTVNNNIKLRNDKKY